jgi:hypothetical protein
MRPISRREYRVMLDHRLCTDRKKAAASFCHDLDALAEQGTITCYLILNSHNDWYRSQGQVSHAATRFPAGSRERGQPSSRVTGFSLSLRLCPFPNDWQTKRQSSWPISK